jgi:hypothetical protein
VKLKCKILYAKPILFVDKKRRMLKSYPSKSFLKERLLPSPVGEGQEGANLHPLNPHHLLL